MADDIELETVLALQARVQELEARNERMERAINAVLREATSSRFGLYRALPTVQFNRLAATVAVEPTPHGTSVADVYRSGSHPSTWTKPASSAEGAEAGNAAPGGAPDCNSAPGGGEPTDSQILDWWFGTKTMNVAEYMEGVCAGWTPQRWREWCIEQMRKEASHA